MTAEIAVINRLAVALAADSAVTITKGEDSKVFPSDNKIFELSSRYPIGLMTYHSTQFFGVPWEVITKDFRRDHGGFNPETIDEWVTKFQNYVIDSFCPSSEVQIEFVKGLLRDAFIAANSSFRDRQFDLVFPPNSLTKPKSRMRLLTDAQLRTMFRESVSSVKDGFEKHTDLDGITFDQADSWLSTYSDAYQEVYNETFSTYPLESTEKEAIKVMAIACLRSSAPGDATTGLVFAGFGKTDLFPCLRCIEVNGVIARTLRVIGMESVTIDRSNNTADIVPFAESDTVDSLLYGRSSEYEHEIVEHFRDVIIQVGQAVVSDLGKTPKIKADFGKRVSVAAAEAVSRFKDNISPEIKKLFSKDMLDIVRHMPKQEIASIAESLVSVSSIRRKVMVGPETVGGPIDVAVISRHEGFVWVKRKYYFPKDINPRYQWRTFGIAGQEADKNDDERTAEG